MTPPTATTRLPRRRRRGSLAVAGLATLLAAVFGAACGSDAPSSFPPSSSSAGAGPAASASAQAAVAPTGETQRRGGDSHIAGDRAPEFTGLIGWLNSDPLTVARLNEQRRVVLIDFWTYTCINCRHTLPYVREWDAKYREHGLTVVGVHSPEFAFEKDPENVAEAVRAEGLAYPIAIDSEMATWRAWKNHVWPATYLIGADGTVRYVHFGEGRYQQTEQAIRAALMDAGWDVSAIEAAARPTHAGGDGRVLTRMPAARLDDGA